MSAGAPSHAATTSHTTAVDTRKSIITEMTPQAPDVPIGRIADPTRPRLVSSTRESRAAPRVVERAFASFPVG